MFPNDIVAPIPPGDTTWADPATVIEFEEGEIGPPDPAALFTLWWPGYGLIAWFETEESCDNALAALQNAGFDNFVAE